MKVKDNQSVFDLAVQYGGSAEAVIDIAFNNNLSITDLPQIGTILEKPAIKEAEIQNEYDVKQFIPATGQIALPGGINYMGIEIDFMVS